MYYYANGLFKAKATTILSKKEYETLLNTNDEVFFQLLRNYGFGFKDSVEELYTAEIKSLKKTLLETLGELRELKIFFYEFDILNTKLIIKEINGGLDVSRYLLDIGNIEPKVIKEALKNKDFTYLEEEKTIFQKLSKLDYVDSRLLNYQIDKLFIDYLQELVKDNQPFKDYLNIKVNLANILTVVRLKALNFKKDYLNYNLFPTESLTFKKLEELFEGTVQELENHLEIMGYHYAKEVIKTYRQHQDLEKLELELSKAAYEMLKDYNFKTTGLGYVLIYIILKTLELKNIKIIFYNRTTTLDNLFMVGEL